MRFRQIHLDFHTSEKIPGIGIRFTKKQFQDMLIKGHVDAVNLFSKCHHGWAYHPTTTNEMHPHLDFDLFGAQIEAAHEIGVATQAYVSAGLDEKLVRRHPEWLIRDADDRTTWAKGFMTTGYHQFCMNSPYLDILITQIEEVIDRYDVYGVWLDIVGVRECYCHHCVQSIHEQGKDPRDTDAMQMLWENTYANYTRRVKLAVDAIKPGLQIFHNGGHIRQGRRDLVHMNTHLELESLPTGQWGYDHFPFSVSYAKQLGLEYLGMTGKFHTQWGEFGGYKHPNALRYEASLNLANGARCSIGDQLHPDGHMDEATYGIIGKAYAEVEEKEPWCVHASSHADVALISTEAAGAHRSGEKQAGEMSRSDSGAVRILLEGKYLFDVVDLASNFNDYKVLILPDYIAIADGLSHKLASFFNTGGKVLATGYSGLNRDRDRFILDLGVTKLEDNPFRPDYVRPSFPLQNLEPAAFVMYSQGQRIALAGGEELATREDPYFNRDMAHFSSHLHTPSSRQSGGPAIVESKNGIYIAWNMFEDYGTRGSLSCKEIVIAMLDRLLQDGKTVTTDGLPAQGIVTLQKQEKERRWIHHVLYASPVKRGEQIEVIEDLMPVDHVNVRLQIPHIVKRIYLAPQGEDLPFEQKEGIVTYTIPRFVCHQMIAVDY